MEEPNGRPDREHEDSADGEPPQHEISDEEVERLDPDAPGRSLFEDDEDANEPNEPA